MGSLESFNPATGELIGSVETAEPDEVAAAVAAVARVQPFWGELTLADRGRYLERTAEILAGDLEEVASLLTAEQGKPITESHTMEVVPTIDGEWDAPDEHGNVHHFDWRDRVQASPIRTLGVSVHASYGLDAQLFRLEHALADVARNIPKDRETRALVAVVTTLRNGRDAGTVRFRAVRP